jgi:arylsulfatase A-like enzyme
MLTLLLALLLSVPAQLENPNVIVILADDLGVDRVGVYGDAEAHTPVIDALASQGALFTRAYSETVCSPTRAALLTGAYPARYGITNAFAAGSPLYLPYAQPTIPDSIPQHLNIAVGKWHLTSSQQGMIHPLTHGFDTHHGTRANPNNVFNFVWFEDGVKVSGFSGINAYLLTYTVDAAIDLLPQDGTQFFMYVALHAPHKPLHTVPSDLHTYPPLDTDELKYRAYAEAMDMEIGRLMQHIDLTNTYVIFLGDNGTIIEAIDPSLPDVQSKGHVYEGGIHVPMIVVGPDITQKRRTGLTHVVDIAPTVADLMGGDSSIFQDGRSFTDALFVDAEAGRQTAYWKRTTTGMLWNEEAFRSGKWKLIRDNNTGDTFLYDMELDPGEQCPIHNPIAEKRLLQGLNNALN